MNIKITRRKFIKSASIALPIAVGRKPSDINDPDGGPFGKVALAWLDWQLKGSKESAKLFQGKNCSLCADPQWVTRKKKID